MRKKEVSLASKLSTSITIIVVLSICLSITTFALAYATLSVNNNIFTTATMDIDLNGQEPVIKENDYLFEPGKTVVKSFYLANNGGIDIYYRVFFDQIKGELADVLDVIVTTPKGEILYSGKASNFVRGNVRAASEALGAGETIWLNITFHFPEDAGNATANQYLEFDLAAEGVQARNNINKEFE